MLTFTQLQYDLPALPMMGARHFGHKAILMSNSVSKTKAPGQAAKLLYCLFRRFLPFATALHYLVVLLDRLVVASLAGIEVAAHLVEQGIAFQVAREFV